MKIVVLGDVHGRTLWKSIIEKEKDADKFIFIGDYFDSRDKISADLQIFNFQEICDWRRARMLAKYEEVGYHDIMLIGNHDYHYMNVCQDRPYSNYQRSHANEINKILEANMDLLQMAHSEDNYLFTHAGVSKKWFEDSLDIKLGEGVGLTASNIANNVNDLFEKMPQMFGFTVGANYDMSGDDICQTPIWIRPQSLGKSMILGVKQVVGHTSVTQITSFPDAEAESSITLIDAQADNQYLIIIDGVMSTGEIK